MTKFNEGDRVRVIVDPAHGKPTCDNGRPSVLKAGQVGVVTETKDGDGDYRVRLDGPDEWGYYVHEDSLEPEVKPEPKMAELTTREVVTTEEVVTLRLTRQQAESLQAITRRVGGDPYGKSRRGDIDRIREALATVGIDGGYSTTLTGSLMFEDEEGLK